jgi:hypothetical protein
MAGMHARCAVQSVCVPCYTSVPGTPLLDLVNITQCHMANGYHTHLTQPSNPGIATLHWLRHDQWYLASIHSYTPNFRACYGTPMPASQQTIGGPAGRGQEQVAESVLCIERTKGRAHRGAGALQSMGCIALDCRQADVECSCPPRGLAHAARAW